MQCPCGSGKTYSECCELIIKKERPALTAEELMRSRYTAYTINDVDYIAGTTHPDKKNDLDIEATKKWAAESDWMGLSIIRTEKGTTNDDEGEVEFIASFSIKGVKQEHHEISTFKKTDGEWYFWDGKYPTAKPFVRLEDKTGRNAPCICGSGKKYKKCCGKEA
ncbi:MAG: YchJ family protein [Ignavibacteria bacterium]